MLRTDKIKFATLSLFLYPALLGAADLESETLQAWDVYVQQARMRVQDHSRGQTPFLQVDESRELCERVRAGEVLVEPEDGKSPHLVKHGLIHDWVGVVFIPNAKLDDVVGALNSYGRYQDYYRPMVVKSTVLEEEANSARVRLLMVQKAYSVNAAVEADDEIQFVRLDQNKAYSVSTSIRVQEIADYGKPSAHALPQDHGPGYVWRTLTVTRLEERDGGTYAEMEMIALSRGIPWALRWMVQPLAERLPRTLLDALLRDTRTAVSDEVRTAPAMTARLPQSLDHR